MKRNRKFKPNRWVRGGIRKSKTRQCYRSKAFVAYREFYYQILGAMIAEDLYWTANREGFMRRLLKREDGTPPPPIHVRPAQIPLPKMRPYNRHLREYPLTDEERETFIRLKII